MIKIQVWSDFVCPFCYIGKRRLEQAIKESSIDVEIEMMSYELDHDTDDSIAQSQDELLSNKYGMTLDEAHRRNAQVIKMAKSTGLNYDYDIIKRANTFKAHRLLQYAKTEGKANELSEGLFESHFTRGIHINSNESLLNIASQVGLDLEKSKEILNSDLFSEAVFKDFAAARSAKVAGVPHFVINGEIHISGAQPVSEFSKVLESINIETLSSMTCGVKGCE